MAQFDVHRNTSKFRSHIPFLLVVQADRFDKATSRVVVPLVAREVMRRPEKVLNLAFRIEGLDVFMEPLQVAAIPRAALGELVCNLADHDIAIIRALDTLIARS